MLIPWNIKKEVSLSPLAEKEKSLILNKIIIDSKRTIINFYKKEIASILMVLTHKPKDIQISKKKMAEIERSIKRIILKTEKLGELIKKVENKWIKTFDEISKIIKDTIKNDSILSEIIRINTFDLIINEFASIYLFIEKDSINTLINETKISAETLLNPEVCKIMKEMKNKFDIIFDFYWATSFYNKKISEEIKDLSIDIRLLKLQLEEKEKELNSARKFQNKTEISVKSKETEIERLRQDREKLSKKIEDLEVDLASRIVMEENVKNQENSLSSNEDNVVWEELAHKAEFELGKTMQELKGVKKENTQLLEQIESLNWQVQSMENLKLRFAQFSTIEAFLNQCEADIDNLDIDEMIKYLSTVNCPINIKQKVIKVVLHFIDNIFLKNVSKWASSSTTWVGWVSWGKYANNFINPILNFVKEKAKKQWTQSFIEFLSGINWKELIEEYKETSDYKTKKERIMSNVLGLINGDEEYRWLFEALGFLWKKFEKIKLWNTDLKILSQNIKESLLDIDYTKRELKKLIIKASLYRRNN